MHQRVPVLFDQRDVNIGLAHHRDFGWHLGAAWDKEVALLHSFSRGHEPKPSKRANANAKSL